MASASTHGRHKPRDNNFFEFGVVGRKTGITVPERERDAENGFEDMDDLFSPDKPPERSVRGKSRDLNGIARNLDATMSSQDMEVGDSTIPEPNEVLTTRQKGNLLPIPRTNSPIKTYLASPARRGTSLGPVSSPVRGDIVTPGVTSEQQRVNRRLDFSMDESNGSSSLASPQKRPRQLNSNILSGSIANGTRLSPGKLQPAFAADDSTMDVTIASEQHEGASLNEDSYAVLQDDDEDEGPRMNGDDTVEEATEIEAMDAIETIEEPEELVIEQAVFRKRTRASPNNPNATAVKRGVGRPPAKKNSPIPEPGPEPEPELDAGSDAEARSEAEQVPVKSKGRPKKTIPSPGLGVATIDDVPIEPEPPAKRKPGRPKKTKITEAAEVPAAKRQKRSEKQAAAQSGATTTARRHRASLPVVTSPVVQRGPPRPKSNGLFILRRETPVDGMRQTRAGRNVYKPLEFWKGETAEHELEEINDGRKSVYLQAVKGVIRAEEVPIPKGPHGAHSRKRTTQHKSSSKRKSSESPEPESDLIEPWEFEPGRIYGDIRVWNPEDPIGIESEERDEELALSSAAIITRDIPGSTFKFAKTLTLPFFGSGMVDLPPGAVKKPKNSRKMQMVFFVHTGRVSVTINENTFRIGKGGMWQVPRGNFYSIENDYEKPARIFFSQGCEVVQEEGVAES